MDGPKVDATSRKVGSHDGPVGTISNKGDGEVWRRGAKRREVNRLERKDVAVQIAENKGITCSGLHVRRAVIRNQRRAAALSRKAVGARQTTEIKSRLVIGLDHNT